MTTDAPQLWDVWHARFDFSEGKGYKYRPVVVVGVSPEGNLVMMVTSAENKLSLEHDYRIVDWKEAGLDKPSIARADRIAEIPSGYLGSAGRIGRLSKNDTLALNKILLHIVSNGE